jgi:hypothetical protein
LEIGGAAIDETSPNSEPVRAAKRQKQIQDNKDSPCKSLYSSLSLTCGHPRKADSVDSARFSVFRVEDLPPDFKDVVDDSFEEDRRSNSNSCTHLQVEIPVCQNLDRDAYAKVSCSSSQAVSTTDSKKDIYTPLTKQQQKVALYDGEGVIPDSQELTGSSSYHPSESVTAWANFDTSPKAATTGRQEIVTPRIPVLEIPESPQQDSDTHRVWSGNCEQGRPDYRTYHPEASCLNKGGREAGSNKQEPLNLCSDSNPPATQPSLSKEILGQQDSILRQQTRDGSPLGRQVGF